MLDDAGMLDDKARKVAEKAAREGIQKLTNEENLIYEDRVAPGLRKFDEYDADD